MGDGARAGRAEHRVLAVRDLSASTYVLRFQRNGLEFQPGQYLVVGLQETIAMREYTIYSAPQDDFLEILVKEVPGGTVSRELRRCRPGDVLQVQGPLGFFTIGPDSRGARFLFAATGTGVSPFHCFARSYPGLDYRLLHGVRYARELYERDTFDPGRFTACVTRDGGGDYRGRVTDLLKAEPVQPQTLCYLCGSCDMIYEAFDILRDQGVPREHLFAEVYF
jgi:ferredoxin--NADP+ reductase